MLDLNLQIFPVSASLFLFLGLSYDGIKLNIKETKFKDVFTSK